MRFLPPGSRHSSVRGRGGDAQVSTWAEDGGQRGTGWVERSGEAPLPREQRSERACCEGIRGSGAPGSTHSAVPGSRWAWGEQGDLSG